MDEVNDLYINYDKCSENLDSANRQFNRFVDSLVKIKKGYDAYADDIVQYKYKVKVKDSMISERNATIDTMKMVIKHREKQIVRLKWHRGILGATTVLGIIATIAAAIFL